MTETRRQRRRIQASNPNVVAAIVDELAFTQNKSSMNARKIADKTESTVVGLWADKHYHLRAQIGDENGKREGIEPEKVHEIVDECLKHLIMYSATVKNFTFLNQNAKIGERNLRVICQKTYGENKTNVTIECHMLSVNEFEITVITAIQKNDYQPSDGQYSVELTGEGHSILWFCSRGKLSDIANI